ncbi:MAG: threonine-phosphate decarboxylase CobD [Microcoleaceae cyanobacterium]
MISPTTRPKHGGNLIWAASLAGCSPHAILDFSASINPLGPPRSAISAIHTALASLNAYPDPNYGVLRQALSGVYASVNSDWILPGNGAAELLTWAGRELAQCSATILVTPAFRDYQRALQSFGARVVEWQFPTFNQSRGENTPHSLKPEFEGVLPSGLATSEVGLLLNNPHNPTGQMFSRQTILPLLDQFALVVVDEAFMEFLPPTQQQSLVDQVMEYPNLVIIRSLTKFYSLPGLRLGYAIAHPDRLRRWQQWRDPWSVNSLAAAAGVAVLQDKSFEQQTWNWLEIARPQLFNGIKNLPGLFPYPSAANFLLVYSQKSVVALQTALLQRHQILIRDCLSFPELGDHYFRVAIRTEAENQRLIEALADVLQNIPEKERWGDLEDKGEKERQR